MCLWHVLYHIAKLYNIVLTYVIKCGDTLKSYQEMSPGPGLLQADWGYHPCQ